MPYQDFLSGNAGESNQVRSNWFTDKLRFGNLTFQDGIFYTGGVEQCDISYDDESHNTLFAVEDYSYWFTHRNVIIKCCVDLFAPKNKCIIEIGAGNGNTTAYLANNGYKVGMFEPGCFGCHNAKRRGVKNIVCGLFEKNTIKENTVESIGIFDVLEHIEDDKKFLEDFKGSLMTDGLIFATVPAHQCLWSGSDDCGHFRRYSLNALRKVARSAGYDILYDTYFFWFFPLAIFLLRRIPYLLNKEKRGGGGGERVSPEKVQQELTAPKWAGKIIKFLLSFELKRIKNGGRVPFGASILMVLRKRG
ncbi:hypothetical protein AGMMS49957_13060 [Synergistales bacterium]|nr:hypothetical protein AGMMS49957_13060 [Synergistales bacterium]